jgi:hypothetical protein
MGVGPALATQARSGAKVFWFFFSKKNASCSLPKSGLFPLLWLLPFTFLGSSFDLSAPGRDAARLIAGIVLRGMPPIFSTNGIFKRNPDDEH